MRAITSVSIDRILVSIQDTFNFQDTAWKVKAIEHIGRGLDQIGCTNIFVKKAVEKEVNDGKVAMPCSMHTLRMITLDGYRLPINNHLNFIYDEDDIDATNAPQHPAITAQVNPNYIHVDVDSGTMQIFYYAFDTDDNGYPKIPNDPFVFEALEWFVVYKLILSGYKHHAITNFREAQEQWRMAMPKAQNSLMIDDLPHAAKFIDTWLESFTSPQTYLNNGFV